MTHTMRRARPWGLLPVLVLALATLACPPAEQENRSMRLSDLEATPSDEDKARGESSEPMPIAQEPLPWTTPEGAQPAARLLDLEAEVDEASRKLAASAEPSPMPEEPRPEKRYKKAAD